MSPEIVEKAGLGYHPEFQVSQEGEKWPVFIIPIDKNHFVARNTDPKADKVSRFHASKGGRMLYTRYSDVGNSTNPTWIVEGEIDALSIADAGGEVIALGSTQNVPKLLKYLSEHRPKAPLILSLDMDRAGTEAGWELSRSFKSMGMPFMFASPTDYKDVNEFLQEDKQGFQQYVNSQTAHAANQARGLGR